MRTERPWLQHYGRVPETIDYPDTTVDEAVLRTARRLPDAIAFDFLGRRTTYAQMAEAIGRCAGGLAALGLAEGDRITISMPTSPQGVVAFYAAARLGAVPSMIHPLSTTAEIEHYLVLSGSRFAITLDAFYGRFAELLGRPPLETLVLARLADDLPAFKRAGFWWTQGRKLPPVPRDAPIHWWSSLLADRHGAVTPPARDPRGLAAILYSSGTTGAPKGIMLSHRNFVSEGLEVAAWVDMSERDAMLAVLPIFHGFGLGALVHAGLMSGARLVMVPRYKAETVAKLMRTARPTLMAGVPTLYESLARDPSLRQADLGSLRAAFSGADVLSPAVRERFERVVSDGGGNVTLLEGYGLTEAVTAVMGMPLDVRREGSIGLPFPDVLAAICRLGGVEELPPGSEGEICISGPPVMLGYLDDPQATAAALRTHADGRVWLHTGDLGRMDEDGFFFFSGRLKRMIKSSGFNVYPAQVEAVLNEHPAVLQSCVIGVPDEAQGERVKAFVVPSGPALGGDQLAAELIRHCRARLIKWSCPREIEVRSELPLTRFGKVNYTALAADEARESASAKELVSTPG